MPSDWLLSDYVPDSGIASPSGQLRIKPRLAFLGILETVLSAFSFFVSAACAPWWPKSPKSSLQIVALILSPSNSYERAFEVPSEVCVRRILHIAAALGVLQKIFRQCSPVSLHVAFGALVWCFEY